ncbi:sialate O-acetylesterase [Pontiellaceae bacterium B12227]|nr:sialate O-acetylesterase [Pontiellaceae bacterium B12227]
MPKGLLMLALGVAMAGNAHADSPAEQQKLPSPSENLPSFRTADVFTSGMVLQREISLPVWGTAPDGTAVTVLLDTHRADTVAAEEQWSVRLPPMSANADPQTLTVIYNDAVTNSFTNVLLGDVWIVSGQSNAGVSLKEHMTANPGCQVETLNQVRFFKHGDLRHGPASRTGKWFSCGSKGTQSFSATGYFMGITLHQDKNIPMGIIQVQVGATPVEGWLSADALHTNLDWQDLLREEYLQFVMDHAENWSTINVPDNIRPVWCYLYNLKPLIPYGIKGFTWYQGESNTANQDETAGRTYQSLLETLIQSWRAEWDQGALPFITVQIASIKTDTENWIYVQDAQRQALRLPNTALVVQNDNTDTSIHPVTNDSKRKVGERMALAAKAIAYGDAVEYSGPLFSEYAIAGDTIEVVFTHCESGLQTLDGEDITGFELADQAGAWHRASATVAGNTVSVAGITNPVAVRYAWASWPVYDGVPANLGNSAGLPASCFNTLLLRGDIAESEGVICSLEFEKSVLDSSGSSNTRNGLLLGTAGYAAGRNGLALDLRGSDAVLELDPRPISGTSFSLTFSFIAGATGVDGILYKGNPEGVGWALWVAAGTDLFLKHRGITHFVGEIDRALLNHLVISYNGSDLRIYRNGGPSPFILSTDYLSRETVYHFGVSTLTLTRKEYGSILLDDLVLFPAAVNAEYAARLMNSGQYDDADAVLPIVGENIGGGSASYVDRRRNDYQTRGLDYSVEITTNLVSNDWNSIGVVDAGFGSIDAEMDFVTNRVSIEEHPEQFIRLRVE